MNGDGPYKLVFREDLSLTEFLNHPDPPMSRKKIKDFFE